MPNIDMQDGAESQTGLNQTTQTINNAAAPGLSEAERARLKAANVADELIDKIDSDRRALTLKKKAKKVSNADRITEHAAQMLLDSNGLPLFSASMIYNWLHARGLTPVLKTPNVYGDAAGEGKAGGLRLPSAGFHGKRYYDLSYLNATVEEKAACAEQYKAMGSDVIKSLIANLG